MEFFFKIAFENEDGTWKSALCQTLRTGKDDYLSDFTTEKGWDN
jgi:hypothetical protein